MSHIFNLVGSELQTNLRAAWLNQRAISNNIANANTPNFQPTRFEADESFIQTVDVQDFSLESEMSAMTQNNLFYQTLVDVIARHYRLANSVVER